MVPVNGSGEPSIPPASPSQRHKGQCTRSVAVHPIRRGAMPTDRVQRPNQQEQTRYRQVNRCHDPSKLHEGRRWVELNREISRRANLLLFGGRRATANPGCGARGRRQGLAGLRDRSLRAAGSRVAISRAGRRPRAPGQNNLDSNVSRTRAACPARGPPIPHAGEVAQTRNSRPTCG